MGNRIEISQAIEAPPPLIWRACATAAGIQNWQADEVQGTVAPGARLTLRWPALRASVKLEVLRVEVGRRLVLQGGPSRVSIGLEPGGVVLTQDGLASQDECEGVASSWRVSLALLAHHLQESLPGWRRVEWFVESVRTSAAAAHVFFTEPAALRTWLAPRATAVVPAGSVGWRLAWGERLTGRVLACTPGRDVALSWEEQGRSVLVFRTLPSPARAQQRLVAAVWSRWDDRPTSAATREGLAASMVRLARALASPASA